jgi:hypothetical protein
VGALLISVLILAGFIPFLAWFTQKYSELWYKVLVADKLGAAETIANSGAVPEEWRFRPLIGFTARTGGFGKTLARLLKKNYIRKLKALIRQVRASSVLKDDTKTACLEELKEVLVLWEKAETLDEIL